jgi:hypothetical protein
MMVKDLVRLSPSTVRLWNGEKWSRVLGWSRSADTSQRVELVLRSGERIGCTARHGWPTQRGVVSARCLLVGDVIRTCNIPEPDEAAAPGYLTQDVAWLAGLYLAEGSRSRDTIQLSLHADEQPWLARISTAAALLGGSVAHTLSGRCLNVRLYGRVLRAAIDSIVGGRIACDKHLRSEVWRLPNLILRAIIEGYLDGDGHRDGTRVRLGFARNYQLERDLRTAAARLGATLTLHPVKVTYQGGNRPAFRGEWRWERSGHWNEKDRGEVIEIRHGRARQHWDIGVEGEPHLFALASGVLTHNSKPNPLPEAVLDRPTRAHEQLFLLTKAASYFYDRHAIMEPVTGGAHSRGRGVHPKSADPSSRETKQNASFSAAVVDLVAQRNRRSVWTITTKPFPGAHFATFPADLVEPCILAGTSERGACAACGAPFERVVGERVKGLEGVQAGNSERQYRGEHGGVTEDLSRSHQGFGFPYSPGAEPTIGWRPTCGCGGGGQPVPVGPTLALQISALVASAVAGKALAQALAGRPDPLVVVALSVEGPLGVAFGWPGGEWLALGIGAEVLSEVVQVAARERWPEGRG